MEHATALDPLPRSIEYARLSSLVCRACAEEINQQQPALYEYLLDGNVESVQLRAGELIELPVHAWLIDSFHVDCYRNLLGSFGLDDGVRYLGHCPQSKHDISSPHPLSQCPVCAAEIEMRQTQPQISP